MNHVFPRLFNHQIKISFFKGQISSEKKSAPRYLVRYPVAFVSHEFILMDVLLKFIGMYWMVLEPMVMMS